MSGFKKAERKLTNPTIALMGPTGSGKTMSALKLAKGISEAMGKPYALIDTENGSASLYSDQFDFDTLNISPPFTTEKYIEAIQMAEKEGYCALIIDSITHAWAGEGGLLEQKAMLDSRPGSNHWTNWNPIKAKDQKLKNAYLHSSVPFIIATMRSKMEYAQTEKDGRKKIEKMGMAPVQSDGIEYEFSLVLDLAMNHECEVSKDRTNLFSQNKIFQITEEVGKKLVEWRDSGKPLKVDDTKADIKPIEGIVVGNLTLPGSIETKIINHAPTVAGGISEAQGKFLYAIGCKAYGKDQFLAWMKAQYRKEKLSELTLEEFNAMKAVIESNGATT